MKQEEHQNKKGMIVISEPKAVLPKTCTSKYLFCKML